MVAGLLQVVSWRIGANRWALTTLLLENTFDRSDPAGVGSKCVA
ncbi:unnamed protein product [Ectocarpus sp. 6 AP-2014]